MGVKRAVELVLKTAGEFPGPIFTWGPLIHNPQTVDFLEKQGVGVVGSQSVIDKDSTVVIRSHGIPPDEKKTIIDSGASICDATCPKVARVHGLIERAANRGRDIVIVGNAEHAEVKGLLGYASGKGFVVASKDDIERLENLETPAVFGQTTLIRQKYLELASSIEEKFHGAEIFDTLCDSTSQRQGEIADLAREADAIIVVGGYNSGNTKRLFEVAKSTGIPSFWVETADELNPDDFRGMETVAVTAGASTPHWVVSRVIERLERFNERHLPPWEWPLLKTFGYITIQSNVLTGLAAAMLAASAIFIVGGKAEATMLIAIGLFVMSMHTIYDLVDWQGLALVDPSKIRFFWVNRRLLIFFSAFGLLVALPLSMLSGIRTFIAMCAGTIFATVFVSLKRMPGFLNRKGFATWRSIPGAKDLLHACGWIFATGIVPVAYLLPKWWIAAAMLAWSSAFSALRVIIFSLTDMETDRVLGRESAASTFGERGAWIGVFAMMALSIVVLAIVSFVDGFEPFAGIEALFIGYMILMIVHFRRAGITRSTWTELAVDAGFVISGLLPFILRFI